MYAVSERIHKAFRSQLNLSLQNQYLGQLFLNNTMENVTHQLQNTPDQESQLQTWLQTTLQNFKLLPVTITPQLNWSAGDILTIVRRRPCIASLELLVEVLQRIDDSNLESMLSVDLLPLLAANINNPDPRIKKLSAHCAALVACRNKQFKKFVMFNRLPCLIQCATETHPQTMVQVACIMFQALTRHPLEFLPQSEVSQFVKTYVGLCRNPHAHVESLLKGYCNCMLWADKLISEVFETEDFIGLLVGVAVRKGLTDSQIENLTKCFFLVLLGERANTELVFHFPRIIQIFKGVLNMKNQSSNIIKAKQNVLFCLTNMLSQQMFWQPMVEASQKKLLHSIVSQMQRHSVCVALIPILQVLKNYVEAMDCDMLSDIIIDSGLIGQLKNKLQSYRIYTQDQIIAVLCIWDTLLDVPALLRHTQSSKISVDMQTFRQYSPIAAPGLQEFLMKLSQPNDSQQM